jgi:hypothetical protein|tara:strand:+ start:621 stop:1064 length:444 start_codon:yes stop_codon:yes gene_type:complete
LERLIPIGINMLLKFKIKDIVDKYNNQPRSCGDIDCNMMILELYEPEAFLALHKKYKTLIGGARKAKALFGYPSILEFVKNNENYISISPSFAKLGDIGTIVDKHCTFLHLGRSYLSITLDENKNEVFRIVPKLAIELTNCKFFRRI